MILCPWCGTSYEQFRSNCKNCGGPIATRTEETQGELLAPPSAPRPISKSYPVKLMLTDGGSIAGFVLALIGLIFVVIGMGLILGVVTAFVGIPFLLMGLGLLAGGVVLLAWRYHEKKKIVEVLRSGEAVIGEVTGLEENLSVSINNRHPWILSYHYRVNAQPFDGKVTTLREPGAELQPGQHVYVLYIPEAPVRSTIYPHP